MAKYNYKIEGADLTEQEEYVLEQVETGKIADLKEKFGEAEENRRLRAKFLEELLTNGLEGFKVHRRGIQIKNSIISEAMDMANAEVKECVVLEACIFKEEMNIDSALFEKYLFFDNSVFHKPVDFGRADIRGQFSADAARFESKEAKVNFNGFKVGQDAFFRETVFHGPVDFGHAGVEGQLLVSGAKFESKDAKANFNGLKVGQEAYFVKTLFNGPVDFLGADIKGQFSAKGARFESKDSKANFNDMKVGQTAFFDNVVFNGGVNFAGADIGGQFIAEGAQFLGQGETNKANFKGIKVGDIAFFDRAVFKAGLDLSDARLLDLMLRKLPEPVPELSLERTVVGRKLALENAVVGKMKASNLEVKVNAALEQVTVQEEADLRDSSFQVLHLHDVTWPKNPEEVRLEGLTYKAVSAGDKPRAWESLLAWVEGSRFNTQNYSELESYFARCGHRDRTDLVFIARRERETNWLPWWKKWPVKIFWGWLAGYGRKPWRAFACSLFFLLLGVYFLNPKEILAADILKNYWLSPESCWQDFWLRFLLSLNFFLPAIDLGFGKHLSIINMSYPTLVYFILHRLAGWVLIPIGLAAITTRLK